MIAYLAQFHGTLIGFYTTALSVFTSFFQISIFFNLNINDEGWVVEVRICCIKIVNILVLHFDPWIEAFSDGLLVPEGLFSPVPKYFGTCFKIRILIELSRKE
jgi:hypothetical protein